MDFSKNIADVLLLYELSMAIGKTLDYRENCASFLKLFLARKGLTACWILNKSKGGYQCGYSLPETPYEVLPDAEFLKELSKGKETKIVLAAENNFFKDAPNAYREGSFTFFNLENQGLLAVHCNREEPFSDRELSQLRPIMRKFMHSLEGATVLARQQKLLNQLEDQNRRLNDYAHVVSHDLKSPLHNINTLAGWIADDHQEVLPEDAADKLRLIQENSERMEMLISGLLRYSSVSEPQGNAVEVNLNKVITEVLGTLTIPKEVSITVDEMPVVHGDPLHFVQLFQNLIDNAVKGMDKEEGKIHVGYKNEGQTPEFFVSDNGKGIDPKYHERIFKIFQKLDTGGTRSGIGLSIVQKIIDHYKGSIWLDSKVGEGSIFYFTLGTLQPDLQ